MRRLLIASIWLVALLTPAAPPVQVTDIQLRAGETVSAAELKLPHVRFACAWVVKIQALNKRKTWDESVYPAWQQTKARFRKVQVGAKAVQWLEDKWLQGLALDLWLQGHRDHEREILAN